MSLKIMNDCCRHIAKDVHLNENCVEENLLLWVSRKTILCSESNFTEIMVNIFLIVNVFILMILLHLEKEFLI